MKYLFPILIAITISINGMGQFLKIEDSERNIAIVDSFNTIVFEWKEGDKMKIKDAPATIKILLKLLSDCENVRPKSGGDAFKRGSLFIQDDSLIDQRFIEDSAGNSYEVEYRYIGNNQLGIDSSGERGFHQHYISLVNIIAFKGNKQKVIFSNIKAIYSPVDCVADNRELWLKRLYQYQNKTK